MRKQQWSQNVQIFGYVFHDTSGQDLCFFLDGICMVRERLFEKVLLGLVEFGVPIVSPKAMIVLIGISGYQDGWKEAEYGKLIECVDLREPTSFLEHIFLECTQCACNPNRTYY